MSISHVLEVYWRAVALYPEDRVIFEVYLVWLPLP
jgi:hypothetical protein